MTPTTCLPVAFEGHPIAHLYETEDEAIEGAARKNRFTGHHHTVRAEADGYRVLWHGCYCPPRTPAGR